jgi:hypothetical protein
MNPRKDRALAAVKDAGLPQHHVARRLLSESVSLNWEIACEAAECIAYLFLQYRAALLALDEARMDAEHECAAMIEKHLVTKAPRPPSASPSGGAGTATRRQPSEQEQDQGQDQHR